MDTSSWRDIYLSTGATLRLRKDLSITASNLAETYVQNAFSREKRPTGKKWPPAFLRINRSLSIRTPAARLRPSFQFFNMCEVKTATLKYNQSRLFSVDETRITVV
jgi:hypothetical protein